MRNMALTKTSRGTELGDLVRDIFEGSSESLDDPRVSSLDSGAERGPVYVLKLSQDEKYVVKPYQGENEKDISLKAAELGVGPDVYSSDSLLVEDYLGIGGIPQNTPYETGVEMGSVLKQLHDHDIIYSDRFQQHFRKDPKDKNMKLYDFGVSFRFDKPGKVDDENAWYLNYMLVKIKNHPEYGSLKDFDPENADPEEVKRIDRFVLESEALESHFYFSSDFSRDEFNELLYKGIKDGYVKT